MNASKKRYQQFPDEELMDLISKGDTSAFDDLYARYSTRLLHYFLRMLKGNEEKAQDFLQDIFLKIIEHPTRFDTGRSFSNWVFSVAHNMCKNEYRDLETRKLRANEPELNSTSHSDIDYLPLERKLDQSEFKAALLKELEDFDEDQRSTFLLRYQENLSIKEISEVLECSEGTVKSRLFYTSRKLSRKLRKLNPQESER